ncbi:MAG: hypothetical protein SOY25_01330 [Eubacteriales bacterium]|nr:hypothetical protein [Eubacteriales bacterium]
MSKYMKLAIIVVAVVVVLGAVAGITYAVWSDTGSIPAGGTKVEVTNTTSKYLIFEIYDTAGNFCYVKFDDSDTNNKSYKYAEVYQNEYKDGVIGTAFDIANATHARVVGYANTNLGELESLIVPSSINVTLGSTPTTKSVTVKEIRMMSPEEFPALDLITEVTLPSSVTSILDGSFMGLENLEKVNWVDSSGNALDSKPAGMTIGADCFTMCPKLTTALR